MARGVWLIILPVCSSITPPLPLFIGRVETQTRSARRCHYVCGLWPPSFHYEHEMHNALSQRIDLALGERSAHLRIFLVVVCRRTWWLTEHYYFPAELLHFLDVTLVGLSQIVNCPL